MKRFVFQGSLGDVNDQRKAWAQKKFRKTTDIHFSIFIENGNWDLKFVFRMYLSTHGFLKNARFFDFKLAMIKY